MARWLGIDITTASVRVALVQSRYRKNTLVALREESLSAHETRSTAIRAAVAGLKADASATALAGDDGFLRFLPLPSAAAKELSNVLSYEVEATLPLEMDDAVMDHRVLRAVPGIDEPNTIPILAGVAHTERVRDLIGLIRTGTGHEPQRVGIGALPLANLASVIPELNQATPVAVLDLDEDHTDFLVLRGGQPRFVRRLTRGTRGLPEQAGEMSRDLRQTIGAWRMQGGEPIDKLYVVGSGRGTAGLGGWMLTELGLQVADLPKPALEGITPDMEAQLPRFSKALALALSLSRRTVDLDLRQGPLEAQQSYQFLRDKTPLLSGLAAAILVSFGFSTFAEMRALDTQQASLEAQLELATNAHFGKSTGDVKLANEMLEDAISGNTGDPVPKMDAFSVLVAFSESLPAANELTHDIAEFDYNRGKVMIKGVVPKIEDAHAIAKKLGEHECFHSVNITRTTRLKNRESQKYTLELTAECRSKKKKKKKGAGKKGKAESEEKEGGE
jgi:general secretion pathway protein L